MIWLGIVLAHLVGDYILQTHWMATQKTERWLPAIAHGVTYGLPYAALLALSGATDYRAAGAWVVIVATHIVIDRFRLAKHVMWFKNQFAPKAFRPTWAEATVNGGYSKETPAWLSIWLMIVADNTIHLLINTAAIVAAIR